MALLLMQYWLTTSEVNEMDDWEGVNVLCQCLDTIIEGEGDVNFFKNKSVLEVDHSSPFACKT